MADGIDNTERVTDELYGYLESSIRAYNPTADFARLRAAYEFAARRHEGQLRRDGSPYVSHPLETAGIVADMGLDDDSLIAALLHDCIEDTTATREEVSKLFGADVADIVDGVTKLTRVQYTSKEEEQMENLRKMLMAMARDIRVILIKIADRLHNMRTMEYQTPEKQREKSLETMEVYAPIAHRLGMQKIKWELEDLSLRYLDKEAYERIRTGLLERERENSSFFALTEEKIRSRLNEGTGCEVYGRIKHIYSIFRKMESQEKTFGEILDLYAFRVVVGTISECYYALGQIHDIFRPIPGRFKDYITTPKPNGYQSLHTTVIGGEGIPFEVQIRTRDMHHVAEYGVAAHWKYKDGVSARTSDEQKFAWIRRLLESQQDSDAQEFYQSLHADMFADEVFVFTPKGDVINLPAGATPIDFAYSIHSAIGNSMTGAIVNGRIVPYSHALQNGDIVEVLTSKASKGPSRDWLGIIKSPEARNKIRQWFKKEKRGENIVHGRVALEEELRRANLKLLDVTREDALPRVLEKLSFPTLDDLLAAIGYGGISAQKAVNKIRDDLAVAARARRKDELPPAFGELKTSKRKNQVSGVVVEGLDNCLVKFAKCCAPVPGDAVVGFITRGFGVSVHRGDCQNYLKSRGDQDEAGRWINVEWANSETDIYYASLAITANTRDGLVMDISSAMGAMKLKMTAFSAKANGGATDVAITLEVKNSDELGAAMSRLRGVRGITEVRRGE
ncbi:MAG: bifunctional (p)ppGpp synthetase/guanosine-3',5'-bis(diphosphate) 3'-pyrophosphohydrolase [Oscillospiraceae bacterium]|jgi:GTP pyrophosphokinase|nr:bifunctional (p)ppGpp synthetase/guanosine-3',5'-bis(diphosphate) 3'-pyrophosphohydrolase [Oscillospiraceae bacterium]